MKIYQVDAFSTENFKGNLAAVMIFDHWLNDTLMQFIAIENNLSETSFARKITTGYYELRWFSPVEEVYFCGYGTLATSFVIFSQNPSLKTVSFHTRKKVFLS